jgi:thioredoxin-dependent peroxiredoxin
MRFLKTLVMANVVGLGLLAQAPPSSTLKVGDKAPDFTLPSTEGGTVHLSDYIGKGTVVVAFFPAAFTGGCTNEMKNYKASMQKFEDSGAKVFGVSTDNSPSQKAFAASLGLNFPLLSDFVDRKVSQEYGVFIPKMAIAGRTTFVIDKDGKIDFIESGGDAIKIMGASEACSRLAHKAS